MLHLLLNVSPSLKVERPPSQLLRGTHASKISPSLEVERLSIHHHREAPYYPMGHDPKVELSLPPEVKKPPRQPPRERPSYRKYIVQLIELG